MFEDTLLIIKSDYMPKRKAILLQVLAKGFQIQAQRKVLFSPENAAEFYTDMCEDHNFMLQVIRLSKGHAEAFILAKKNAIADLANMMVCYFLTSSEMEQNVHVSRTAESVQHEITFIFPNYIHEPIPYFEARKFHNNPLILKLVEELYNIHQKRTQSDKNWRQQLADWLTQSSRDLPHISNQCSSKPFGHEEKGQQTTTQQIAGRRKSCELPHIFTPTSVGSSMRLSSSSCVTCSCFDGGEMCLVPPQGEDPGRTMVQADVVQPLETPLLHEQVEPLCEEEIEWVENQDHQGKVQSEEYQAEEEYLSAELHSLVDMQSNYGETTAIAVEQLDESELPPKSVSSNLEISEIPPEYGNDIETVESNEVDVAVPTVVPSAEILEDEAKTAIISAEPTVKSSTERVTVSVSEPDFGVFAEVYDRIEALTEEIPFVEQ